MNLLEINAYATRQYSWLQKHIHSPLDAIAILGLTLLTIFDNATDGSMSIEQFAEDFHKSLIESYKTRTDKGSERIQ